MIRLVESMCLPPGYHVCMAARLALVSGILPAVGTALIIERIK
jgi:hypothetical protein